jgi:hypothetical protein
MPLKPKFDNPNFVVDDDTLDPNEALRYAMKMGMSDSLRGIQQMFGKVTGQEDLLEKLKEKDQKLKTILEHPEYGKQATQAYLGSAIALDPIGWVPFVGWAKKAKTLADATKYGAGMGAAYGTMAYVGEGESRALNAVAGATAGGLLGLGGGAVANAVGKALGKAPPMPSVKDRQRKFIEDEVLLTKQDRVPTQAELDDITNRALEELQKQKPEKITQNIQNYYTNVAGEKVWNTAVQNWGAGLVGVASGVGGYNAFNDPDSTEAEKVMAGLLFALGGVGATKAIGKLSVQDKTLDEIVSAGIVDNYGLPKKYVDLKQKTYGDVNTISDNLVRVVKKTAMLPMSERKALYGMMTGEVDSVPDLVGFSKESRNLFKEIGQELVDAGLLSEKVYRKNAETYLHRTYLKHVVNQGDKNAYNAAREIKLIGDEFRRRGQKLDKTITYKTLASSKNPNSKLFGRYDEYEVEPIRLFVSKNQYNKIQERIKKKKRKTLDTYKLNNKVTDVRDWKVVDEDADSVLLESIKKVNLRRDYTKEERQALGEIEDAAFAIAETGRLMTNDLAVYKLYSNLAKESDLSISKLVYENKVNKGEVLPEEWVEVPTDSISALPKVDGEPIKRYGELAGKYVPKEIYDDLTKIQNLRNSGGTIERNYLAMNRLWKKTKTAWNPVVHVNNTVSNVILYDLADASYKFLPRGFTELRKGLEGAPDAQLYNLAKSYGVFDVDIVSKELTKETKSVLDETLKSLANEAAPEIVNAQKYSLDTFKGLAKKGYEMTAGKLENLYQLEDQAFRMGLFMDRIAKGMNPAEAAADAKKWFINYDINAPFINLMRRYPTPFLSYTYRVVPLLSEAAVKRPWKFAKWSAGAYALNEVGKEFGPGDEEKERLLMRDDLNQRMFGMPFLPRTAIKTPFASERGEDIPLYLDVKRFIPGGDVFSLDPEKGIGIPVPFTDKSVKLPTTLSPSFGPLGEIFIPLMTGVDPFTLQKLEGLGLGNDDKIKMQHIMSRLTPNIPATAFTVPVFGPEAAKYTPFSQSFGSKKIVKAFRQAKEGAESQYATDYSPFEAIMSTFGFKLQPVEMAKLLNVKDAEFRRFYATVRQQFYRISRRVVEGQISREEAESQIQELYKQLDAKQKEYTVLGEELREPRFEGGKIDERYPVSDVKENPSERIDPYQQQSYLREEFAVGGEVIAGSTTFTPLEQELQYLQSMSESGEASELPAADLYEEGIEKQMNRLGFNKGGLTPDQRMYLEFYKHAKDAGVSYPEAVAAQASLESGHGQSELTQKYNNPLGLKVNRPSEIKQGQKAVQMATKEFVEGKEGVYKEPFRVFNSLKDSFVGYKEKVAHPRYESIRQAKNADEYLVAIQDSGYATDPKYAEKTINIMRRYASLLNEE